MRLTSYRTTPVGHCFLGCFIEPPRPSSTPYFFGDRQDITEKLLQKIKYKLASSGCCRKTRNTVPFWKIVLRRSIYSTLAAYDLRISPGKRRQHPKMMVFMQWKKKKKHHLKNECRDPLSNFYRAFFEKCPGCDNSPPLSSEGLVWRQDSSCERWEAAASSSSAWSKSPSSSARGYNWCLQPGTSCLQISYKIHICH